MFEIEVISSTFSDHKAKLGFSDENKLWKLQKHIGNKQMTGKHPVG